MVDNSVEIKKLMHWEMEGDVYYVQVMRRAKDGADHDGPVKDFHIHNLEQFDREYPEMKRLAELHKARVMIRLNQRNTMDANILTQMDTLRTQLEINRVLRKIKRTGDATLGLPNIQSAHKSYSSALGRCNTEASETRKWIIDIDPDMVDPNKPGFESLDEIAETFGKFIVENCAKKEKKTGNLVVPKIYGKLPSKHGLHLVTSTFAVNTFTQHFGKPKSQDGYIMDDANTNLYIPD